jgi:hypothetical protein
MTFAEGALLVLCFMWLPEGIFGFAAVQVSRLLQLQARPIAER